MDERLSVAPMLDCSSRFFRFMMRGVSRRCVLYSEMVVDSTLLHNQQRLASFLSNEASGEEEGGEVLQLGGFDPQQMADAAQLVSEFRGARYQEINVNCGCPSAKVVGKCFGAKLMLDPPLVRRITSQMIRRVGHKHPVTVKCRIGADDRDQYEHLCEFIHEVRSAGVQKFIVHARKCHLSGLSTKQNRNIPPLQYEVVHRLVTEFPDLKFVLNGGLTSLEQVQAHMGICDGFHEPDECASLAPVHGCMVGRAVYANPYLFSHADTEIFGASSDPLLTRGQLLDRYCDYCDRVTQEEYNHFDGYGSEHQEQLQGNPELNLNLLSQHSAVMSKSADDGKLKIGKVLDAAKNLFHACKGGGQYRQRLKEIHSQELKKIRGKERFVCDASESAGPGLNPTAIIRQAVAETIRPDDLEEIPDCHSQQQ